MMTKRLWFTTDAAGTPRLTKADGATLAATVTVRAADEVVFLDGVWVDGERSYDTYVIVDDCVRYDSPPRSMGLRIFELHEARGGGSAV
jgi:hypothetical protein